MLKKLFRGKVLWNGQHYFSGDWVEGFYAYKSLEDKHVIMVERAETQRYASYFVEIQVDSNTVGQYTGLKDKNGVMIYDGDIVCKAAILNPSTVVWRDKYACFAFEDWSFEDFCDSSNIKDVEIIGNIHDKED